MSFPAPFNHTALVRTLRGEAGETIENIYRRTGRLP